MSTEIGPPAAGERPKRRAGMSAKRKLLFSLVALLLLAFAAELVLRIGYFGKKTTHPLAIGCAWHDIVEWWNEESRREQSRIDAPAYTGADWAKGYWSEHGRASKAAWMPFVYARRRPFSGKHINIDENGRRRTWSPEAVPPDSPEIWVFGGSTVWGTGARDDYTIPSCIARNLAEAGRPSRVVNLGESGWVSTQEIILLQLYLITA